MIDAFGETVYRLSLNKQRRRGDPVRLLDYEAVNEQRADMGLTDAEIAQRVGLSVDQARFIRIYLERQNYRIDQHRRLFALGGGRRWRPEKYSDPAQRMSYPEPGLRVKKRLLLIQPRYQGSLLKVCGTKRFSIPGWQGQFHRILMPRCSLLNKTRSATPRLK